MNSFVLRQFWPVLLLLAALRLMFGVGAFPNPDEAYYWLWGQHLDWSYFDHPPFHAWIQGAFTTILGRSHFVLRLPTLMTTGLLFWLYGSICCQLYTRQKRNAFWMTVLLFLTSPLFFLFSAMAWHDHWLILFGTASSYCLARFLSRDRLDTSLWLYGAGLFIGLAGLCKYVALFLGIGFLVAIATHRRWRSLLSNLHLYGSMALALLIMTPVFWWNAQHEFYSFQFYLGRSVQTEASSIQWWGPVAFLLLSAIILGPIHPWLIAASTRRGFTHPFGMAYQRVSLIIFGTSTVLLAALSLRAPVLYYWNILAYPLLFPLMATAFLDSHHLMKLQRTKIFYGTLGLGVLAATLLTIHYAVLPLSALISETGDDDTRMLYGWRTVAEAIQQKLPTFSDSPLLLTTDYRSASALAYALNNASVMAISGRIDQFDFWHNASSLNGRDGILVGDLWHPICPAHLDLFERVDQPKSLTVERFGIFIKEYELMQVYGFRANDSDLNPLSPDYLLAFTSDGEACLPSGAS